MWPNEPQLKWLGSGTLEADADGEVNEELDRLSEMSELDSERGDHIPQSDCDDTAATKKRENPARWIQPTHLTPRVLVDPNVQLLGQLAMPSWMVNTVDMALVVEMVEEEVVKARHKGRGGGGQ